jgi:Putative zinc-finger
MTGHISDEAALYALGSLSDDERAAIDAHVQTCSSCAALLGTAEQDVALVASMEPQHDAPTLLAGRIARALDRKTTRQWQPLAALAAAFVIGLLPSAYFWQQNQSLHATMSAQTAAIQRVASAPHRMAHFRGMNDRGSASVMYAPDGSWYVVLVRDVSKSLQVAWMHDGEKTTLGTAQAHDGVAMLYLPRSHRMDQLALMDGARTVAIADLSY